MNVRMTDKLRSYGRLMGGLFLLLLLLMGCTGQGDSLDTPIAETDTEEPLIEDAQLSETPEPSIFMPQLKTRSTAFMEALLIGDLVLHEGCLRVEAEQESTLVIWQADYYLNNHDGTIEILDDTGDVVAQIGETVYMGGGEVPFSAELVAQLREPLPEGCGKPQKVWLMGEFLPEEYIPNVSGGE